MQLAIKQEQSIARIISFTFFIHAVAIKTLTLAENKFIRKSYLVKYVFIGKSRNGSVHKYQDIGSTVDSQAKHGFYLLIMMLGRFSTIIYLSLWYISDSQDVLIIGEITVHHVVTKTGSIRYICLLLIFDIVSLLLYLKDSGTIHNIIIISRH